MTNIVCLFCRLPMDEEHPWTVKDCKEAILMMAEALKELK